MQGGSTNLSEQNIDRMPQSYGFSNLNRRSLFLADGNQRSYYALPENYSLQCATSSTSPAIPTVEASDSYQSFTPPMNEQNSEKQTHQGQDNHNILDMLAQVKAQLETISEKLRYALVQNSRETISDCIEKNDASKPLLAGESIKEFREMPMYDDYDEGNISWPNEFISLPENTIERQKNDDKPPISKAAETGQTSACLSHISDSLDYTLEQQQDIEKASVKVQQLRAPQVNVLVIHERRKEWDPGVSKLKDTVLDKGAVQVQFVQQSTELSLFSLEFSISSLKRVQCDPGVKISLYKWFNSLTVWTAADKQLSCAHIPDLAAWQNQSVGSAASYNWDPGTLLWYKFIWWLFTVRTNFEHNSYSTPKFNGSKAAYSSKIFQKYKAMNSQLYWHEDIKCYGVALWLIHFQPP